MPIQSEDIKLLKSAVMADVPEGGGAMTGVAVIDGQSNNLFPDTSAMDRAFGRVALRKVFGVAHSDDTDTLMGAHAIITEAPADPLVHCTMVRTPGWADTRDTTQNQIEKYLVKGPRMVFRLWDTHYAGSLIIKLISLVGGTAPAGGDAIVLRNPNGSEQYVRILRVSTAPQTVAVVESGTTVLLTATVATCELGNPLEIDFLGPPAQRVGLVDADWTQVFSTNVAAGSRFYGIKPLAAPAAPGDYSVIAQGGIYTPVVPAATVESSLVDQYPLLAAPGLCITASGTVTVINGAAMTWAGGVTLTLPTLIEPRSLSLTHGGVAFTDDGKGVLLQAGAAVGTVGYRTGTVTLSQGSPNYGSHNPSITYRPATGAGAQAHSDARMVTLANQGLVYVESLDPPPARGTYSLEYMAQGRWYTLLDGLDGRVAGVESSHGIGTVDYTTGSVSVTLGAIPDIGSPIIHKWGERATAQPYAADELPTKLQASVPMELGKTHPPSVVLTWAEGGAAKTATVNSARQLSGDGATGLLKSETLVFTPSNFPDGDQLTLAWRDYEAVATGITSNGSGSYTLTATPVQPGSVYFKVALAPPADLALYTPTVTAYDRGDGTVSLVSDYFGRSPVIIVNAGTVDYATGAVQITAIEIETWAVKSTPRTEVTWFGNFGGSGTRNWTEQSTIYGPVLLGHTASDARYSGGLGATQTKTVTLNYEMSLLATPGNALAVSDLAFLLGGETYTAKGGVLRRAWSVGAGAGSGAGTVSGGGLVRVEALPANRGNAVTWRNAAVNMASPTINAGVFRTASAPLKVGVFQLGNGAGVASNADGAGELSGSPITGLVDFARGVVRWRGLATRPDLLRYNAVFLQYLPLDKTLLGIDTVRLPLDGRAPVFAVGDLDVVHNTLTTQMPNPLTKGEAYTLGRERIASVRIKDALGVVVPSSLYVAELDAGFITVPVSTDLTPYTQPLTVEHRIEDMLLCASADISGQLKFTRSITHHFPAGTSFVSSALPFGDLFSRSFGYFEQQTWTGAWSDERIGNAPAAANFNETAFPVLTTNRGAITGRWALIFTSTTAFRIVGEDVGEIGAGNTAADCAPINPATGAPFFTLPALGWGGGWATGNVLRFNTAACGSPFWLARTVLQGPASLDSDVFSIAFRGDVDRP